MKTQFKTAIFSICTLIITISAALLLTFFSERFITKWFDFINAILTGILTSGLLILLTSLINFTVVRKSNARNMWGQLDRLKREFYYFLLYLKSFIEKSQRGAMPDRDYADLIDRLEIIVNITTGILSSDKISPLSFRIIKIFGKVFSKLASHEFSFFESFSRFADNVGKIYTSLRVSQYKSIDNNSHTDLQIISDLDEMLHSITIDDNFFIKTENYIHDLRHVAGVKTKDKES